MGGVALGLGLSPPGGLPHTSLYATIEPWISHASLGLHKVICWILEAGIRVVAKRAPLENASRQYLSTQHRMASDTDNR